MPTRPPSSQPATITEISSPSRTHASGSPKRRAIPVIQPSRGPGPSAAVRYSALPAPRLTDREMEVLRLVAKGLNNRDIAKQLFISENTVKNHVRNILEKLQLHSRMEAVVYAVREKLLEIT